MCVTFTTMLATHNTAALIERVIMILKVHGTLQNVNTSYRFSLQLTLLHLLTPNHKLNKEGFFRSQSDSSLNCCLIWVTLAINAHCTWRWCSTDIANINNLQLEPSHILSCHYQRQQTVTFTKQEKICLVSHTNMICAVACQTIYYYLFPNWWKASQLNKPVTLSSLRRFLSLFHSCHKTTRHTARISCRQWKYFI